MAQPPYRSFSDATGRVWRVSELFATVLSREIALHAASDAPVPLLFACGGERRWTSDAPVNWRELDDARLREMLDVAGAEDVFAVVDGHGPEREQLWFID